MACVSQDDVACRIWRGREDADGGDVHASAMPGAMWAAISLAVGSVEDASVSQWGGEDRKVSRGAELVFGSPRTLADLNAQFHSLKNPSRPHRSGKR